MRSLRLVETFAELRRGMVVVDIACECGCVHEAELVELHDCEPREAGGPDRVAWRCEPDCAAESREHGHFNGIDAHVVGQHRIFEVLGGVAAGTVYATRKLVRAR